MKFNIKKVATVIGSALMLGATAGMAVAAAYPAPFVQNGSGDVAIVYGANAASSDAAAAASISTSFADKISTPKGKVTVSADGGDIYKIEGASENFNLGSNATMFRDGSVTKADLPKLLADGVFRDKDNTEKRYTQELKLSENLKLDQFSDYDYEKEEPTLGFKIDSNQDILTYRLIFTSSVDANKMKEKDIEIMGKSYYIHEASNDSITLLDSSDKKTVVAGEPPINVAGKTVSIQTVSDGEAELIIDGDKIPALGKGATYKLDDGTYLAIIKVVEATRERDEHQVEFTLGTGKMFLKNGTSLRLNDRETIREIEAVVVGSGDKVSEIGFKWKTDKAQFLTEKSKLTIPRFENIALSTTGVQFPAKEEVRIEGNGADKIRMIVPLENGDYNLDLAYFNKSTANYTGYGRDASNKLVISTGDTVTFNDSAKDRTFILSWRSTSDFETYVLNAKMAEIDDDPTVTLFDEITGEEYCKDVREGRTCRVGRTDLKVTAVNATTGNSYVTLSKESNNKASFSTLYTKEGMKISLPAKESVENKAAFSISFYEEDKDNKIADTRTFGVSIGSASINSENRTSVSGVTGLNVVNSVKVPNVDEEIYYMATELATKVNYRYPTSSQKSAVVTYHGSEVMADVFVSNPEAVISEGATPSGQVTILDSEVSSVGNKNLIVVGGSCVNTVAADLLGGALCGEAFSAKTGIVSGEAIVKSYDRASGKIALLVAGYEAADTQRAVTWLNNKGSSEISDAKKVDLKISPESVASARVA